MLSARPYLDPAVDPREYAERRLQGTVWERLASARACYRGLMAVGVVLGRIGISANLLTGMSLVLAAVAAVAAAAGLFGWAALLVIASGVLDVFDGVVARATGTATPFGALLDSTADRLSDGLPLLGIALFYAGDGGYAALPVVAMLGGFTVSYVRARAESLGARLPSLFMRRAERVILLVLSLLAGMLPLAAPIDAPLLLAGLTLIAVLNGVGAIAALRAARDALVVNADRS